VVLLFAAEGALRLAGWITLTRRARQAAADVGAADLRILSIGESTTFGLGVAPEEAYPAVLGPLLESALAGRKVASLNRGVPGLTTAAMVRSLPEKLALYRPQVVTIMAGANDYNAQLNGLEDPVDGLLPAVLGRWVADLRLYKMARLAMEQRRPGVKVEGGEILFYRHGASRNILYDEPRDADRIAAVTARLEENLEVLIGLCRAAGARPALVGYIQAIEENRVLERVAARAGVPYVSSFVHLDQRPPDLFGADGWHPSPRGHRHIAAALAPVVADLAAEHAE
jgi:lysophospholipase L1-like esterase